MKKVEDMLQHYITLKQDIRDLLLPRLDFAVINLHQDSTKDTPFFANLGKHPCMSDDMRRQEKPSKNPQAYDSFHSSILTTKHT